MTNSDKYWKAVETGDRTFDGSFVYGVITTGVYCRPSCPSRLPLRKNIRFYETPDAAESAGLRACKRCDPRRAESADWVGPAIRDICNYIEVTDHSLSVTHLASRARMSVFHFQRCFKKIMGVTPGQYLTARRMKRFKESLRVSKDVTEAIYDAGFGSSSRVYERSGTSLGMTPKQYRQGGAGVVMTYAPISTSVGLMMVAATDRGLSFVQFGETEGQLLELLVKEYPAARVQPMTEPHHPDFEKWVEGVRKHLTGQEPHLSLPLDLRATAFQMRVWNYLQSIPYGEVQSYSEVAAGIGQPRAVRAVANACARNRVALVIPCHRVIRGTGELGGYRWGLARKRALIDHERGQQAQEATSTSQPARTD
jgi:AraC family transcriptional regulator, regulatory protein of adaptative response / methylated-DNA-[protein]-cysteine methyltransferase